MSVETNLNERKAPNSGKRGETVRNALQQRQAYRRMEDVGRRRTPYLRETLLVYKDVKSLYLHCNIKIRYLQYRKTNHTLI